MLILLTMGSLLAATAVFAVALRTEETVNPILPLDPANPALASETTGAALRDPANETLSESCPTLPPQKEWHVTKVNALCDAEDLLDCLESQGFAERELVILGKASFAVRWR